MIRAYDDYGNVVDMVDHDAKVRANAIDECIALYKEMQPSLATNVYGFGKKLEQLKEHKSETEKSTS